MWSMWSRRTVLRTLLGSTPFIVGGFRAARAANGDMTASLSDRGFSHALQDFSRQADLIDAMRGERADRVALEFNLERAPITSPPSSTRIDTRASDLIVACEVSGRKLYEDRYRLPTWPKGKSGITIGIGYDIGYASVNLFKSDWNGFLNAEQIKMLAQGCGIYGNPAAQLLPKLPKIAIDWSTAVLQFYRQTQPRYVGETEAALPNCAQLNPTCLGALVSLTYNRGSSFEVPNARDPSGRFAEMRNIHAHMTAGQFAQIPKEIRAMKRLWQDTPDMRGLLIRRELEATLFEVGLDTLNSQK
jgi:hypothetical protein